MQQRPLALVTGASRGIGEQFARQLAQRSYDLVLTARDREALDTLAAELSAAHRTTTEVIVADLATRAGMDAVAARIGSDRVPDLVVNNAGFGWHGSFAEQDPDLIAELVELDVLALTLLSRAALAAMTPRRSGAILNVSSTASFVPGPSVATYHAAKAYVTSLTEALHVEAQPSSIKVSALCPGITPTGFQVRAGTDHGHAPSFMVTSAERVVREGLAALDRNQAICVPGAAYKFIAVASRIAPRWLVRFVAGQVVRRL